MRKIIFSLFVICGMPVQAALVDNGSYTSDTVAGLDWLDLDLTFTQSMLQAEIANSGWRLATETEVTNLFGTLFPNFSETGDVCSEYTNYCGTSRSSSQSAAPDQNAKVAEFIGLFGYTDAPSQPNTQVSQGRWLDELGGVHTMGAVAWSATNTRILGIDYLYSAPANSQVYNLGTYLVRTSVVPIPAAVWLFGSALAGLGCLRRQQAA